jgi:hypothetical protein
MPKGAAWPPVATAETFADHDYPDFAQEFLRRNPGYRKDYRRITRRLADGTMTPTGASEAVRKWGLVFRLRSRPAARR